MSDESEEVEIKIIEVELEELNKGINITAGEECMLIITTDEFNQSC